MVIASSFQGTKVTYHDLTLAPIRKEDLPDLASWPRFRGKKLSWANFPATTTELQKRWFKHQQKDHIVWIAVRNEENKLIGRCSVTEPLSKDHLIYGIVIRPDKVEQGIGTMTTKVMLRYIFSVTNTKYVWLESRYDNIRAHRTWEKVGFIKQGDHFRREVFGRYDRYLGYKFPQTKADTLPEISIIREN